MWSARPPLCSRSLAANGVLRVGATPSATLTLGAAGNPLTVAHTGASSNSGIRLETAGSGSVVLAAVTLPDTVLATADLASGAALAGPVAGATATLSVTDSTLATLAFGPA